MVNFIFSVNGQELECDKVHVVVSDSVNYLNAQFSFSQDWAGLDKYAHFDKNGEHFDPFLITEDKIEPTAGLNLTDGIYRVTIHGEKWEGEELIKRITTSACVIKVTKSGVTDEYDPFPSVTKTIGEQLIARVQSLITAIPQKIKEYIAEHSAELRGPEGAPGRDGKDGVDGRDGQDGAEGPIGPQGIQGPAGRDGIDGVDGRDGKDAEPYDDTEIRRLISGQNENIAKLHDEKVGFTDYASSAKAGVVLLAPNYGTAITSTGAVKGAVRTKTQYDENTANDLIISKGTLENVVNPSHVVHDTDYATADKGGVVKVESWLGHSLASNGALRGVTYNKDQYATRASETFISKGTLENVLTPIREAITTTLEIDSNGNAVIHALGRELSVDSEGNATF